MSTDREGRLGYIEISGSHHDIGVQLGRFGREIAHRHLVTTHAWATVMAHRDDGAVVRMREMVAARFPAYWQELKGLSEGLGLPFDDVFLWNCRGDVWARAPDGCTTVQIPGDVPIVAHNEDGDPGISRPLRARAAEARSGQGVHRLRLSRVNSRTCVCRDRSGTRAGRQQHPLA